RETKSKSTSNQFIKDDSYHPFMLQREYVRALNSAKIERLLAKPFIKSYDEHTSGVCQLALGDTIIAS
ncbi:hypothetical protein FHG87_023271, partial [Trinorchestia longiramus]